MKSFKVFLLVIFAGTSVHAQLKKYSFQQPKMGSLFSIVIYTRDSSAAAAAAAQAYLLIDTLNQVYSDYIQDSELNQLCARSGSGEWVKVSETLFGILQDAYNAAIVSEGTFDITVGPVIRLWRTARREKRMPNPDSLSEARRRVGYQLIEIDSVQRSVRLKFRGMQLDLGGIAKGETAQRAYDRVRQLGFPYALIDAGGDVVAGDVPPGVEGWRVSINLPGSEELMARPLLLKNMAVTTSGDLYQYVELNGRRYSHIINPKTGLPLTHSRNVTVISGRGEPADWLTKACSILHIRKAMKLVARFPATEVQIAVLEKGKPRFYRSTGFTRFLAKKRPEIQNTDR